MSGFIDDTGFKWSPARLPAPIVSLPGISIATVLRLALLGVVALVWLSSTLTFGGDAGRQPGHESLASAHGSPVASAMPAPSGR
jgi:hypothetical protein